MDLVEVHGRAHGDVVIDGDLHPLGQRLRVEDPLQLEPQVVFAAAEVDDEVATVIAEQVVAVDGAAEVVPELGLDPAEQDELPVLRLIVLVLGGTARPAARAAVGTGRVDQFRVQRGQRAEPLRREHRVGTRHVEVTTLTGARGVREPGRHAERREHRPEHHTAADARAVVGGHHEALVVEHQGGRGTAEVVHHLPVRGHFGVRPGRAVAGGLAVDDVGLDRLHRLVVEPELGVRRADVAGDEDVGVGEQPRHDRLALGGAGVHGDAALVAVEHEVEDGVVGPEADHDVAEVVAELRRLDLHHVGALVAEQAAEVVDRHQHAGLHDADTFEQVGHEPPTSGSRPSSRAGAASSVGRGRRAAAAGEKAGARFSAIGGDALAEVGASGRFLDQAEGLVLRLRRFRRRPVGRDLGLDPLHRER